MVMPGDDIAVTVELISPVAMEDGMKFAIRGWKNSWSWSSFKNYRVGQ